MATTAIAAAAMAALTASQAPGVDLGRRGDDQAKDRTDAAQRDDASGDDSYHTELPPLESPAPPTSSHHGSGGPEISGSESGIPASVLAAYKKAERSLAGSDRGCGLRWQLLAAIGKVESGQARGGAVGKDGTTLRPILGPVLNGSGFARITDSDGGQFDGDARFDRAVGPMQFIPSTWSRWGADGNGDGRRDPGNVYDAALSAGHYLCGGQRELAVKADLDRAVLSYNNSRDYLRTVLAWYEFYRKGTHQVPDGTGPLPTSPGAGGGRHHGGNKGAHKGGSGSHHKPGSGRGDEGGNAGRGGKGGSPTPTPTPSPTPTTPTGLKAVKSTMSAPMGEKYASPMQVRVTDKAGRPVKGVGVRYSVPGTTGPRFGGLLHYATVTTDSKGIATAPAFFAGAQAGTYLVRATIVGHHVAPAEFRATVTPAADALVRTTLDDLTAGTNAKFADRVEVRSAFRGADVADVPLTATMITDDAKPVQNDKGPHFKDAHGKSVRTLTGLKTDRNGLLTLPDIFTDSHQGTFTLRLATREGTELRVQLNVT